MIEFATTVADRVKEIADSKGLSALFSPPVSRNMVNPFANLAYAGNNIGSIQFGDTYIYGANEDTVEKHKEVTRQFANDLLEHLRFRR